MVSTSSFVGNAEGRPRGLQARFFVGESVADAELLEQGLTTLRDLAALPGLLDQAIGVLFPEPRRDYKAFWDQARCVAALFRKAYLCENDRNRLWREYADICRRVKELGQAEREDRAARSAINLERVKSLVHEAGLWARGGRTGMDLAEGRVLLRQAMDVLKTESFLHRDRRECFAAWREALDALNARRGEVHRANYDLLMGELRDAAREATTGDTFEATHTLRALRSAIKATELSREQRLLLRDELRVLWGKLILRIEARKAGA